MRPLKMRPQNLREEFAELIEEHVNARLARGESKSHIGSVRYTLKDFFMFIDERGIEDAAAIDQAAVEAYLNEVWSRAFERAHGSSAVTYLSPYITRVRGFFNWALKSEKILCHPMAGMEIRRGGMRLPKNVLTIAEMRMILEAPDTNDILGIRNRAILELMYSSGLRQREVTELDLADVDLNAGTVFIREGKGRKDRVVPMGAEAVRWMKSYLSESRPMLEWDSGEQAFFLSRKKGRRLEKAPIYQMIRGYEQKTRLGKHLTPHLIRHTCATHMVQAGADLRYVQELLGHESIETTKVYLHLTVTDLKKAHRNYHPRGKS